MKVHSFEDSGLAYDMCQCDDNVGTGDILVIEREQIIGVAWTWPLAVTKNQGVLHTLRVTKGETELDVLQRTAADYPSGGEKLLTGYKQAVEMAAARGWR